MFFPEISEEVNKITILARKLKGEAFKDLQHNEVAELLKAHTEEVSEEETERLVTADKGEERETEDQNKAHEQRLTIFPISRTRNWPTSSCLKMGRMTHYILIKRYKTTSEGKCIKQLSSIFFQKKNPNKISHY